MAHTSQFLVLLDVDGPVADMLPTWVERYNADWDDNLGVEDITAWDMDQFVKPECGAAIYEYLNDPEFYERVQPTAGALEGVREIRELGRVVYVTACVGPEMAAAKTRWMFEQGFLDRPAHRNMHDFIIARDKSLIIGDVLIDDGVHNLNSFSGMSICFEAPYNRGVWSPSVAGWDEIPAMLRAAKRMIYG